MGRGVRGASTQASISNGALRALLTETSDEAPEWIRRSQRIGFPSQQEADRVEDQLRNYDLSRGDQAARAQSIAVALAGAIAPLDGPGVARAIGFDRLGADPEIGFDPKALLPTRLGMERPSSLEEALIVTEHVRDLGWAIEFHHRIQPRELRDGQRDKDRSDALLSLLEEYTYEDWQRRVLDFYDEESSPIKTREDARVWAWEHVTARHWHDTLHAAAASYREGNSDENVRRHAALALKSSLTRTLDQVFDLRTSSLP